jgi:hypothetical protein
MVVINVISVFFIIEEFFMFDKLKVEIVVKYGQAIAGKPNLKKLQIQTSNGELNNPESPLHINSISRPQLAASRKKSTHRYSMQSIEERSTTNSSPLSMQAPIGDNTFTKTIQIKNPK